MASILPAKQKPQKRKKNPGGETLTLTLDNLKTLGHQLLSSRAHINNIPVLLSFVSPSSPLDLALESLISLQSFFVPVLPEIPSSSKPADNDKDPELVYQAWIRSKFDEFVNSLITIAVSPQSEESLQDVALDAIMDFVKMGKGGQFQSAIYHRFLNRLVRATASVDRLLDMLVPKYFKYMDVRYFTYTSMGKIAKTCSLAKNADTTNASLHNEGKLSEFRMEVDINILYNVLSRVPPLEIADKETSYEMWSPSGLSSNEARNGDAKRKNSKNSSNNVPLAGQISKKLKSKFTKAWISFLRLPLPLDIYKEVLVTLHQNVIPYMANPVILCDFLTRSYDIGGVISVMALSGLFILMTRYGLEYPNFYLKLYALLTPAVFMAKHRAMFFQLLDTCLKSSYLPAYLAAAFAKKLSRLALSVQPSGALIIIAVIHNLLRRHPSINFLVHQEVNEVDQDASVGEDEISKDAKQSHGLILHSKKLSIDPFNNEESNPAKSDAMRSSLWEIDTLRHHYCPAVSRFVESLENDLTIRAKTSEVTVADFSSGSYATIFRDEVRRRIKQVPLAFYKATPTLLFSESDFAGWTFGDLQNGKQDCVQENSGIKDIENEDHEHVKRQCVERP